MSLKVVLYLFNYVCASKLVPRRHIYNLAVNITKVAHTQANLKSPDPLCAANERRQLILHIHKCLLDLSEGRYCLMLRTAMIQQNVGDECLEGAICTTPPVVIRHIVHIMIVEVVTSHCQRDLL